MKPSINVRLRRFLASAWVLLGRISGIRRHSDDAYRVLASTEVAALIAWLGLLLGVVVSIWGADVRRETRAFFSALGGLDLQSVRLLTLSFWIGLVVWARLLYVRLTVDEERRRKRVEELDRTVEELKGAIFRAPNPTVYERAKTTFDRTVEQIDRAAAITARRGNDPAVRRVMCRTQIQAVLEALVEIVKGFTVRGDSAISYRANVMLMEECRPGERPPFPPALMHRVHFYDAEHFAEHKLLGLLYIPSELTSPRTPGGGGGIHSLVLPVPFKERDGEIRRALPGGPWAFLTGEMSVYEDTRLIDSQWPELDAAALRDLRAHFAEGGTGSHVRSFASFRIGNRGAEVGVLNLDCNCTNILGTEPGYYATFHALIGPFLRLLASAVTEYETLARNELLDLPAG